MAMHDAGRGRSTRRRRQQHLVAEGVADAGSQQEEEDGEGDEQGLQRAVDAQCLDEEQECEDAPQSEHHLIGRGT